MQQTPSLTKLKTVAVEAAHAAGKILMKYFRGKLKVSEKPGAGLVTNADIESQAAVVKILKKAFPQFHFLTEEEQNEKTPASAMGKWIIDPLDGTTNFVHGFPMFCVSIAAEWANQVQVGVVYHPVLEDLYVGVLGKGATRNGKRIQVSSTSEIEKALLTTGFTYRKEEWLKKEMSAFEQLSSVARAIRRPGSAALDLVYTACGVFDGFWERRLSPWDVAAGALIVQEAGGLVTDFNGNPFRVQSSELLAANPKLHPLLQKIVSVK